MFNPFSQEDPALDEAIASVYKELRTKNADAPDYARTVTQLRQLYALKHKRVDPNVVLTVLGNLAIGFAVLRFEQTGIVTSKVWTFLARQK